MPHRIAIAGNSATWRRGMEGVLSDAGYEVSSVDPLDSFTPGVHGNALVIGLNSQELPGGVVDVIEESPFIPVIVILPNLDLLHLAQGLRLGAVGVVDENSDSNILLATLAAALSGLIGIPSSLGRSLAFLVPEPTEVPDTLTDAELEWLRAMAAGSTVAELAEGWGYSERAMFRNLKSLYVRIGVNNRTEALLWASRQSLLSG